MSKSDKTLFLLDAYALIYRAHFAFTKTPRISSKGVNTSVPFGFTNSLFEVITKQKPSHIAVAFDTSAKTFRDDIFKEYKATRQETPEDIRYGIPKVKEIIRGFYIPIPNSMDMRRMILSEHLHCRLLNKGLRFT
jgi:DNA polymerase-1